MTYPWSGNPSLHSDPNRSTFTGRADFAAFCAWIVGSLFMAAIALLRFGEDFRGYYAAARVVLAGGNPYNYHALAPVLLTITGSVGNYPYYYAPWLAWFMIPFAWLPFPLARAVWMLLNWGVWILALLQLGSLLEWPSKGWRRWLLCLLATIVFAWFTWRTEQLGILLASLLVAALLSLRQHKWIRAGIWLALLLVKPNITLIPVMAIALWLLYKRTWKPVFTLLVVTVGLIVVASLVTPGWYLSLVAPDFGQGLFDAIAGPGQSLGPRLHTTLYDWLKLEGASAATSRATSMLGFVVGGTALALVIWRSKSPIPVAAVSLLVNFAVTPYALQYDFPVLTLPLFWGLALGSHGRGHLAVGVASALGIFVASVPVWERPISDGYWMVIGLIGLAVWSWYTADRSRIRASWI